MKMKHLYSLILLAAAVLGFVACSDDDYKYESTPEMITITQSELLFKAEASTGTVAFDAPGAVTVTTDKEWCHPTLSGNTVNVTVDENTRYEGRMATVTLKYGDYKKDVYVQQNGVTILFQFKNQTFEDIDDLGTTINIDAKTTDPFTCTSTVDWITVTQTKTGIAVKIAKNTKRAREGQVIITSPAHDNSATLTFRQNISSELPEPTLEGNYVMTFHTSKAEDATDLVTKNVTLRKDAKDAHKFYLDGLLAPDYNYSLTFTQNEEKKQLVMQNCNLMGPNGETWLVAICLYTTATSTGTVSYTMDGTRDIYFDYELNEAEGIYNITLHNSAAELIDPANTSKGFSVYNFSSDTEFKSGTRKTSYLTVRVPELVQIVQ